MKCAVCEAWVFLSGNLEGSFLQCVRGHRLVRVPIELVEIMAEVNGRVIEIAATGAPTERGA